MRLTIIYYRQSIIDNQSIQLQYNNVHFGNNYVFALIIHSMGINGNMHDHSNIGTNIRSFNKLTVQITIMTQNWKHFNRTSYLMALLRKSMTKYHIIV